MRLAVISDIHGNAIALDAVLADIKRRGADATVNLGDCCAGPLWPRETFERLAELSLPTVRGNHDRWISDLPREQLGQASQFEHDQLSAFQRATLGALPPQVRLGGDVLAVHGAPGDDTTYLLEQRIDARFVNAPLSLVRRRLGDVQASLVLCGHSHNQQILQVPGGPLVVNPGSVGCPVFADSPEACRVDVRAPHSRYAIVTRSNATWSVELIALAYDWESAGRRAIASGRPDWARTYCVGSAQEADGP